MSDPFSGFVNQLVRDFSNSEATTRTWEFWSDGRRHSRTILITLSPGVAQVTVTIAQRVVDADGCMRVLESFSFNVEHLPRLLHGLNRALAVAREHGLIKQPRK
jgi:hypothetical protein